MPFLIENHIIPFSEYSELKNFNQLDSDFLGDITSFMVKWFDPAVASIAQHTSGSTGKPKTISLSKEMMRRSALNTIDYFGLKESTSAMLCLPVRYIAGKMMLVRAVLSNLDLILNNPSSFPLEHSSGNIDFVAMTPHQASVCINNKAFEKATIKNVLLGGAPVSSAFLNLLQLEKTAFFHSYGMTETASHVAIRKLNGPDKQGCFTAMPGILFSIDTEGCLRITGEYLEADITTNDVVKLISEKEFIWLGRKDNVINSGGLKIIPEQMEMAISHLIEAPFLISSVHDDVLGDKLVLLIENDKPLSPEMIKLLSSKIRKIEDCPIAPSMIVSLPRFIYTANGKLQRNETINLAIQNNLIKAGS